MKDFILFGEIFTKICNHHYAVMDWQKNKVPFEKIIALFCKLEQEEKLQEPFTLKWILEGTSCYPQAFDKFLTLDLEIVVLLFEKSFFVKELSACDLSIEKIMTLPNEKIKSLFTYLSTNRMDRQTCVFYTAKQILERDNVFREMIEELKLI